MHETVYVKENSNCTYRTCAHGEAALQRHSREIHEQDSESHEVVTISVEEKIEEAQMDETIREQNLQIDLLKT